MPQTWLYLHCRLVNPSVLSWMMEHHFQLLVLRSCVFSVHQLVYLNCRLMTLSLPVLPISNIGNMELENM